VAQGAPVQRVPIGPQDIETTDPQNRARVLTYLRSIGPYELRDVLQRMQQQNDQRNSEYIQIIHKELARDNALNNINDITHQQGGVWTSATIFYEKRPVHSTAPALAGAHDETDHFGVAMSGDYESSKSVMDSEVSTLAAVGTVLQQLLHNYQTGVHIGKRIDILITGNMGPCDGCKARINRFINACNTTWRGVNFEIEVNYTTPPNDVRRGRGNTTYGDHDDGARTSPSGLNYHHHTF
ncbi:MAG TPA: hypothetical protein VIX73_02960, partial [Kofleriaceae bacterium]